MEQVTTVSPKKIRPVIIGVSATAKLIKDVDWCAHGINHKYCQLCKDKPIKKKTKAK